MSSLHDLFILTLRDIYFAEKAITKALPKMAKNADNEALIEAFKTHREETVGQIERLEQVFQIAGQRPKAERCEAIEGLIEEADEVVEEFEEGPVRDAGLLASASCVEHYEMGRYTALIAWAEVLGMRDAVDLLRQNLEEEKKTDALLTKLAKSDVNKAAASFDDEDEEDDDGEEDEEEAEGAGAAPARGGAARGGRKPGRAA